MIAGMPPKATNREMLKLYVKPAAKRAVERASERYGMSMQELGSRVYEWFAQQDESVQAGVLDLLPREHRADIARLVMARMSEPHHGVEDEDDR